MPTLGHYADVKLCTPKKVNILCVTRSDFTTGRLADCRGELPPRSADFRHYWLRDVTINDKQRLSALTKRYKRLL